MLVSWVKHGKPRSESTLYGSLVFHKPIFVGGYDTTG